MYSYTIYIQQWNLFQLNLSLRHFVLSPSLYFTNLAIHAPVNLFDTMKFQWKTMSTFLAFSIVSDVLYALSRYATASGWHFPYNKSIFFCFVFAAAAFVFYKSVLVRMEAAYVSDYKKRWIFVWIYATAYEASNSPTKLSWSSTARARF